MKLSYVIYLMLSKQFPRLFPATRSCYEGPKDKGSFWISFKTRRLKRGEGFSITKDMLFRKVFLLQKTKAIG